MPGMKLSRPIRALALPTRSGVLATPIPADFYSVVPSSEPDMKEPHISTKFHHPDWDVTFVVWSYRKITKVEAVLAVQDYLKKNNGEIPAPGSRVPVLTAYK